MSETRPTPAPVRVSLYLQGAASDRGRFERDVASRFPLRVLEKTAETAQTTEYEGALPEGMLAGFQALFRAAAATYSLTVDMVSPSS
jgi:hypothetical protein